MPKANPRILFLDDQLVAHEHEQLERYLRIMSQAGAHIIEASNTDIMFDQLNFHANNKFSIDGFLIDLMLPHVPTDSGSGRDFTKWGAPSVRLLHDIGGAQVIKLMRHHHYEPKRNDPSSPLHVASHFLDAPVALFTTYEEGGDVSTKQEVAQLCDRFIWKDSQTVEQELADWIHRIKNHP